MINTTIDFLKYKRFFAIGCSFTDYCWPTCANIISKEIPNHYIYAQSGAGNFYIYQALIEAMIRHTIDKDDLVMIMFSNVTREDRFIKGRGWVTPGNIYYQSEYDDQFLTKHACQFGYLMRDLNLVHGCKLILDTIGCDYELMSIVPFHSERSDDKLMDNVEQVLDFYSATLNFVRPSVLETVFNNFWDSRLPRPQYHVAWQNEKYKDNHPTPSEHLEYLQTIFPDIAFLDSTLEFVNTANNAVLSENFTNDVIPKHNREVVSPGRLGSTLG